MGFQYELAKQFAQSLGLKLKVKTGKNTKDLVYMLQHGEGDLIAYPLPVTKQLKDSITFCGEDIITHQVLVQRNSTKNLKALTDVTELIGKNIYVKPGKYTMLATKDDEEKFNVRIGVYVKEYSHAQEIVLAEGEEITAVSTDIILR